MAERRQEGAHLAVAEPVESNAEHVGDPEPARRHPVASRSGLDRSGLGELLGADNIHRNWVEAGPKLVAAVERGYCSETCRAYAFADCTLIPRSALVRKVESAARYMPQI